MMRSPPIGNAIAAGHLSLGNVVEAEGGLHVPAHLGADDLSPAEDFPAVGAVVVAPGPVHDALQVEVLAASPYCCLVLQADRALSTTRELSCFWDPVCWNNVNKVVFNRRRWRSEKLAGR